MAKKPKKYNSDTFAKGAMRRASLMWPPISECRKLARRERGKYECAMCKELFSAKEVQIDHRQPVVDIIKGWESWDVFIARLFCDVDNLDCLCVNCHKSKSAMEVEMRKYARAKRKAEDEDNEEE
jgi:5-methylcytosine-specific restriction endonuclease McrA